MAEFKIHTGNVIDVLPMLESGSVQVCVTSPPYFGLRDYGMEGQLGLESSPEEYVEKLVAIMREVRRVLRKDGTLWLNLGDTYANTPVGSFNGGGFKDTSAKTGGRDLSGVATSGRVNKFKASGLKQKDLIGVPWMVAFALRADGWYLRSDIIWNKPNPMPESVTDRPTKAHEYLFLLSKSQKYFYDHIAIAEPIKDVSLARLGRGVSDNHKNTNGVPGQLSNHTMNQPRPNLKFGGNKAEGYGSRIYSGNEWNAKETVNKKSVWTVATQGFGGAHFAVFPPELIKPCILAGTSDKGCCAKCGSPYLRVVKKESVDKEGWGPARKDHTGSLQGSQSMIREGNGRAGSVITETLGWQPTCKCEAEIIPCTVLDIFSGAGTTGLVSLRHNRNFVGVELNPSYVEMSRRRIINDNPLFNNEVAA